MSKKRIVAFDIIKMFAMFLVLWGHCMQSLYPEYGNGYGKPVYLYIYSFHMPLFMIISGYFAQSALNQNFLLMVYKKFRQFLLPSFIIASMCALLEYWLGSGGAISVHTIWYDIWFPKSLFFLFVLLYIYYRVSANFSFIIGLLMVFILTHVEPLFGIAEMFPSFFIGWIIRKYDVLHRFSPLCLGVVSLILYLGLLLFWNYDYGNYDLFKVHKFILESNYYNMIGLEKEWYRIIVGLAGSFSFFSCFYAIFEKCNMTIVKDISILGQETLGVYFMQAIFLERLLRRMIDLGNVSLNVFSFFFAPIISIVMFLFCYCIVRVLKKNIIITKTLFYQ